MKTINLKEYIVHISDRLYTVYDGQCQILILYPEDSSVCCSVKRSQSGTLQIDAFWGIVYDVRDREVFIYYRDEVMM